MRQIELKNITKVYRGDSQEFKALNNVTLNISRGDFVAVMGPSGSGKSTLMNIIGALTKPTRGSYRLEGEDIAKATQNELAKIRRDKVGFVFQNFNLIPKMPVMANVELPMVYKRMSSGNRRKKTLELLKRVRLEKRARFKPTQLSGGEMQRVAIARALANSPEIILADEPTGNLDSKSGEEIVKIFNSLNKEGITIVLVTHESHIAKFARKIIELKDGKIEGTENVY